MPEEKKYRNYTAADIEKYHKGLLTPAEMHAIEKAALDDPFLADALEGYGAVNLDAAKDIADLQKSLDRRINPSTSSALKKINYGWLRAAAVVVLLAGGALLVYQFGFNKSSNGLATNEKSNNTPATEIIRTDTNTALSKTNATIDSHINASKLNEQNEKSSVASADKKQPVSTQGLVIYKTDSLTFSSVGSPSLNEVQTSPSASRQEKSVSKTDDKKTAEGELFKKA